MKKIQLINELLANFQQKHKGVLSIFYHCSLSQRSQITRHNHHPKYASIINISLIPLATPKHDDHYHLTQISCNGESLFIPRDDVIIGDKIKLQIFARDISISLEQPTQSRILNIVIPS